MGTVKGDVHALNCCRAAAITVQLAKVDCIKY